MRCASPPLRVGDGWPILMYPRPTSSSVLRIRMISLWTEKCSIASRTLMSSTSAMFLPLNVTQRGVVEPLAVTDFAGNVDVGEEVHLDDFQAVALAGFAAAALDVE